MSTTRERRKRRRNRFRRNETVDVSLSFTRLTAESDKATTNFVNLHRLTTDRTPRIDERKDLRFDRGMNAVMVWKRYWQFA